MISKIKKSLGLCIIGKVYKEENNMDVFLF